MSAPTGLFRVGRPPDPFAWPAAPERLPDSERPLLDGRRWDDPAGEFATLYAGTDRLTVYAETIAPFREVPGLRERVIAETSEDDPDNPREPDWQGELGVVPPGYFSRVLARAEIAPDAPFIDVDHPATHRVLNAELGGLIRRLGVAAQYDRGVVMAQDRRLTRGIARFFYEHYAGEALGLRYESRLANGLECWALWPPAAKELGDPELWPLSPEDPVLGEAAELLGVRLPDLSDVVPREWVDRR